MDAYQQVIRDAIRQGWVLRHARRGGHDKLLSPDGERIVVVAASPSDHRAVKNLRALLRRNGIDL